MPAKSPEPPKITLKFGGQKMTSSASMSVDNESLKRQQELVRAGANGFTPGKGRMISFSYDICIILHSLRIHDGSRREPIVSGDKRICRARHERYEDRDEPKSIAGTQCDTKWNERSSTKPKCFQPANASAHTSVFSNAEW